MDDIFYGPTFDDIVGVIEKREQGRPSELLAKQKAEQMVVVKVKMMMEEEKLDYDKNYDNDEYKTSYS